MNNFPDPSAYPEPFHEGTRLAARGDYDAALACFEAARRLCPSLAGIHHDIGVTLTRLGRESEAAAAFAEAIALAPSSHASLNSLGNVLRNLGEFAKAAAACRRAIALSPENGSYYLNLVKCGDLTIDDPLFARMARLTERSPPLADEDRVALHFALADVMRKAGQQEAAFAQLLSGNALHRTRITYDEPAMMALFARARATFTRAAIDAARVPGKAADGATTPIFIIGMPRSGTTLVEQILSSHPLVFGAGEVAAFPAATAAFSAAPKPGTGDVSPPPAGAGAGLERLGTLYLARLEAAAGAARRPYITDKYLFNFLNLGLIHAALPHARIIHCRRDPIDTCLSCFARLFNDVPFAYDLGELGRYYRAYQALMAHWAAVLAPQAVLDVTYEDLVGDFPGQVRRMLAHCGLAWDDACLAFHQTARIVRTESSTEVRKPLYRAPARPWRPDDASLRPLLDGLAGGSAVPA